MKRIFAVCCVLIVLMTVLPVSAAAPEILCEGYSAVLYDNTNGLPTSDTNAVVQTAEGFLWIGSYCGLLQYDGKEFYRFDSSTGISSVVSLYVDSRERLWVGTNDSGVFYMENGAFTSYGRADGLRSSSVRSIIEDSDGNILLATTMGLAYIAPDNKLHFIDDPQVSREYICELVAGSDGEIFGVTNAGTFFTIRNLRVTGFYDGASFGVGNIYTVYPDPEDKKSIYIGTSDGKIVRGDLSKKMADAAVTEIPSNPNVHSIRMLGGTLWVCTDRGIGYLDGGRFVPLNDLPMTNSVEHVMEDYEGNLWFTSSRQGLMKIVRNRFTDISALAELPPLVVNSTWLQDGLLYLGTDTGLKILDSNYKTVTNALTERLNGVRIRTVKGDSKGAIWFGTNSTNGLLRYEPKTGAISSFNSGNGLASDRARTMFELSDGRMAVATNAGVCVLENGKVTATYNRSQGIANLEILCLEESPDGRIYAGSDGDGIYVIDDSKVSRLGLGDGLHSEIILRIRRDPTDRDLYWIITSNSIAHMRGYKITTIRYFPYSNNFDMYFDDYGRIWVLSSNGIYVVKRTDMLADRKIDYTLYDTQSGLPCASTANSFSCVADDGMLYIAAATGVSSVNINADATMKSNVRLSVPYVLADEVYVRPDNGVIRLPSSCKKLRIFAYAFSFSLNNPRLRYRLEGFDDTEAELTQSELTPLMYTNLPGGTYTFRLSEIDTMTGEAAQELTITIVKEKTLMEHVWFNVLLGLLGTVVLAGAVFLYYRRKTKALLKKQHEHKQLIDQMTKIFASCVDMKDSYTNGHSHRVAKYTVMLAKKLGKTEDELEDIFHIALLHDIGKIAIPDNILNKPGRLTDEEFVVMKSHSQRGYDILKEITIAPELAIGAGYHHERLDGRGYPNGLKGDEIPFIAQIIAVADTFDAMFSTRPYRKRMELADIEAEIRRCSGTQLNESVVNALMELISEGAFDNERPN